MLRVGSEVIVDVGRSTVDGDVTNEAFLCNVTLSGDVRFQRGWRLRYFAGVFNLLDDRTGFPVGAEVASGTTVARYPRTARMGLGWTF
jgi:hypothetical protein